MCDQERVSLHTCVDIAQKRLSCNPPSSGVEISNLKKPEKNWIFGEGNINYHEHNLS